MMFFLHQEDSNIKVLVTFAIGNKYRDLFHQYAKDGFLAYCKKFGYDLICITESLDQSERAQKRSPAWQKLLILSQPWSEKYERVLWMDTDIIINMKNAKDILRIATEIDMLESDADRVMRAAISQLFRDENDFKRLMKLKAVYELLETITDKCEDVANILEGIVLENA